MKKALQVERRRQFCLLCGQLMFEFYRSPDGHYGVVDILDGGRRAGTQEVRCPTCGTRYRWLNRLDEMGRPIARW